MIRKIKGVIRLAVLSLLAFGTIGVTQAIESAPVPFDSPVREEWRAPFERFLSDGSKVREGSDGGCRETNSTARMMPVARNGLGLAMRDQCRWRAHADAIMVGHEIMDRPSGAFDRET